MPATLPRLSLALALSLLAGLSPTAQAGQVTGLIIDARGLTLERTMAPTMVSPNGVVLFPVIDAEHPLDADFMLAEGLALYARSIEEAWRLKRLGGTPMVVKAIAVDDGDLILDEKTVQDVLQADSGTGFLEKHAVAIVH